MTIEIYYLIYIFLLSVYAIAATYSSLQMKAFLSVTDTLDSMQDINTMKLMIKKQKSLSVFVFPFGFAAIALFAYYSFSGLLAARETIVMVVFLALNTYATIKMQALEKQIAKIPAASDALEKQRDHIVYVWQKRLLPNFDQ